MPKYLTMFKSSSLNNYNWELPKYETFNFFRKRTKYCICIPVLNESNRIKNQLKKMLPYSKMADIILADGGSTDNSMNKKFLKICNVKALLILKGPGKQGTQLR